MTPGPQDVANLLGGLGLLAGFALLTARALPALVAALAAQGGLAALALAWPALLRGDPWLLGLALLAGLAKALLVPLALRRLAPPLALRAGGAAPLLLAGLGLVVLACLAVLPVGSALPAREDLAIALSVLLLGLLLLVIRRHPAALLAGLLAMENGLTLLAATLPGPRLAAALPGLALLLGLAACGLWLALGPGGAARRAALRGSGR